MFFSAQLLAKIPGHRPRYFNRYNDILDIRQHVDLISVQNPCWLMKKYWVKNYPNLSNINCELSGSSMGFPFKKKPSFGLKKHFDSRNLLLDLPGQVHEAIRSQLQSSAESDCICRGLVEKFPTAVSASFSEFPSCVCVKSGPGGCEHSGAESTMHRLPT